MQCPACSHIADDALFGQPAKCPECGAYYDKAIIARAKRSELMYQAAQRDERRRKIEAAAQPTRRVALMSWSALVALFNSQFYSWALITVVVVVAAVMLAMRGEDRPAPLTTNVKLEQPSEYAIIRVGQRSVESRLKDADSAKFRNQFVGKSGVPCGEVNAKNGFGGYNGFKRYIASGGGVSVVEDEMPVEQFEATWQKLCAR